MKTLTYILIVIIFATKTLSAQNNDSVDIWQCINAASEKFHIDKSFEYADNEIDLQKLNLKSNFYPQLKLEGLATYQSTAIEIDIPIPGIEMPEVPLDQYKCYVELNQLVYDGGITNTMGDLLELQHNEQFAKSKIQRFEIENNVAKIYFIALLLDKQSQILENQLTNLKEQLKIVEISIKNQVLTPVNRDILKSEILKLEQKRDENQIMKMSAYSILSEYTGLSFDEKTKLTFPSFSIVEIDTNSSPRIDMLDVQSQKIDVLNNQVVCSRRPQVYAFLQGGYGKPGLNMLSNDFNPYFYGGVKFSWKIYDWNNSVRNQKINELKNQQIQIEKQNIEISLNIQKENLSAQIKSLENALIKDDEIIELQQKILKIYDSQLENGIITTSDYIIELNKLTQAQLTKELHLIQIEQLKFNYLNIY